VCAYGLPLVWGIDQVSNVRWVYVIYKHAKNIEGYYQEIGRAGREESPLTAHTLS